MDGISGIDEIAAAVIIVEIGIDISKFKIVEYICFWVGLSSGNNESVEKKKFIWVIKGNIYIKRIFCEVVWSLICIRDLYFVMWYWKVK